MVNKVVWYVRKSWHGASDLSPRSLVLPSAGSASKMLQTTHCAGRTAQSAQRAATKNIIVILKN